MNFIILGQNGEVIIEVLNTLLSLAVVYLAFSLSSIMKGGALTATWNWIVAGISSFALLEIYGLVGGLSLFKIDGIEDIFEFVILMCFLIAFLLAVKSMKEI